MDNSLLTLVRLLKRALPLKELPRTGWIMEGATRSDSDSVAAHSYCVALASYLTDRELNRVQTFAPIRWERVLAMATLHDLAESVTGDDPFPILVPGIMRESCDGEVLPISGPNGGHLTPVPPFVYPADPSSAAGRWRYQVIARTPMAAAAAPSHTLARTYQWPIRYIGPR